VEGILSDVAQKKENDSSGAQMKIRANFFSPRFPRSGIFMPEKSGVFCLYRVHIILITPCRYSTVLHAVSSTTSKTGFDVKCMYSI
jgi:hypothetical protein